MALDIVQEWHNVLREQERKRVLDRIAYGTKASSPQILMARRMNSLYYSNPLPDNSSGSKNRPIGAMKDESGRPNANQQVAMAQGKIEGMGHNMRGGVLRNYKYAKMVLNRLGTDTENINLASQGIPAIPGPLLELSDVESRKLELDTLITSLSDAIETGNITSLTVGELKNIPRLMVSLAPTFTENDITQLIRQFESMIEELDVETNKKGVQYIIDYFEYKVLVFLYRLLDIINLQPQDKDLAVRQLVKEIFKYSKKEPKRPQVPEEPEEEQEVQEAPEEEQEVQEAPEAPESVARPASESTLGNEQANKIEQAIKAINDFKGRASTIPEELKEMYTSATRRQVGDKNFGTIKKALKDWVQRNATTPRFNSWYDKHF